MTLAVTQTSPATNPMPLLSDRVNLSLSTPNLPPMVPLKRRESNTSKASANSNKLKSASKSLCSLHSLSSDTVSSPQLDSFAAARPFTTLPRHNRLKMNDSRDPVPYMVVEARDGELTHEEPYEYVKLSEVRKSEMEERFTKLETTYGHLTPARLTEESLNASSGDIHDINVMETNRRMISKLTCQELLEILECAGLGQYKERFEREMIDGSLFLDLDEDILKEELNVKSKIHRVKIMRLITGKQSMIDVKRQQGTIVAQ